MPRPKKTPEEKILNYLSKPFKGEWTSAKKLAKVTREPMDTVVKAICELTDGGLIEGVKDRTNGDYFVRNPWQSTESDL